jgi:TRAP-type C4-dicarboxylate transport system substrate-binding protein
MKVLAIALFFLVQVVHAATFKVGVLAPEGTNWAKNLKKMAKEIKTATDKKVKIKFYFGGSQGDEPDVLRKIRVGQLHGGVFTGKTLGEVSGDVRVMELPFTFYNDSKKAWKTLESLTPYFDKKFVSSGFHNLGFFEIGMVYFVSRKKTPSLDSLKGVKIWSWEGDELVASMINAMDLVSVPLPLPDVLSSLSTGIIDAAYAPPLGILSLQWNTKISYLLDFPLSFSIGAFLLSEKSWKKISPAHQKIVTEISNKYIAEVNKANEKDNADALGLLKSSGVEFISFPAKDIEQAKSLRAEIIRKLKGKLFTEEALNKLEANK